MTDTDIDLLTIIGNRPQFIKMAPVSSALRERGHRERIVHTGQHYDDNMSQVFFDELSLPAPQRMLRVQGRSHGAMTGEMLAALEREIVESRPPFVLLYGDTNSTLAGALAAVKLKVPIVHVEAGPRIHDLDSPEEINRIVADHASRMRFCPDLTSVKNLARENICDGVFFTGDVMFDAFLRFSEVAAAKSSLLRDLGLDGKRYALLTTHRPNNTDAPEALDRLRRVLERSPLPIVFPIHPRTEAALKRFDLWERFRRLERVKIVPPVGYLDVLALVNGAEIVVTDSGGLQKEAFFAGKPAVLMFRTTPWPEIEAAGWQRCRWEGEGIDVAGILADLAGYRPTAPRPDLFGDGRAAHKIVDRLEQGGLLRRAA